MLSHFTCYHGLDVISWFRFELRYPILAFRSSLVYGYGRRVDLAYHGVVTVSKTTDSFIFPIDF
jgi:hypothetical protein